MRSAAAIRLPRAALALGGVFFLLGFVGASWIGRIPAVQAELGIDNGVLGAVLVGMPLGSVAASLALPSLVSRFGSRRVVTATLPFSAAALLLPGLARDPATLALALVVLGAATGALDVAMNTHGVAVQRDVGRSVFARLHALWSLGGFVGAAVAAALAAAGLSPLQHFAIAAAVAVVAGVPVTRALSSHDDDLGAEERHRRWSRQSAVLVLAVVCVAAFVVEVVAADWGGVFLHRVIGTSTTTAAAAFAAFAFPHFLIRAFGDPLVDRLAAPRLLAVALAVSAAGLGAVAAATNALLVFVGLAVTGAGIGLVVPVGFAAAGRVPGVPRGSGVATVAGISYLAWTVAPAVVGGLSALTGLRAALLLAPATAVTALAIVLRVRTV